MASSYPPEKKVEYWTKVVVLVSAICASGYGAWLKLGDVVTLPELVAHDESKKAHEPLREIIRAQAGQDSDLDRKLIDLRHELESLGERAVSLEAADREPDRRN